MDISQAASRLLTDQTFLERHPPETLEILRSGNNKQYLDTLAHLALQPSCTEKIFSWHHTLSVEICSRWLDNPTFSSRTVAIFAALARILPTAPYLAPSVKRLLQLKKEGPLKMLISNSIFTVSAVPEDLQEILLALCRLLDFDNATFAKFVSPAQLQLLLTHAHYQVRYLVIRILCLYVHASEAVLEEMVNKYVGQGQIHGKWDDRTIDYTLFTLYEERRLQNLRRDLIHTLAEPVPVESGTIARRFIRREEFSPSTVCLAGILLPHIHSDSTAPSSLVMTKTVKTNMESLAKAIKSDDPVILTGPLGAGKTSLVRDVAKQLGCDKRMIALHLNEQTDAKLLVGIYTTAGGPGSFRWQPGVLTKAVTEGRWVLLEDYDRAPADIVSALLPLLERRELSVPHKGESIRAAPGFKLIATVRSHGNNGDRGYKWASLLGIRHWHQVNVLLPPEEELGEIAMQRFPLVSAYGPSIMGLYTRLSELKACPPFKESRMCSPQELFRWVSRISSLLQGIGIQSQDEPIPNSAHDSIFLEAVGCFAGSFSDGASKELVVALVAEELHVSRERVAFCLSGRKLEYPKTNDAFRLGRVSLSRKHGGVSRDSSRRHKRSPFATTPLVLQQIESIAMAVKMAEPCLLVGETGTGKTAIVQHLAASLNHKLVVVNLSQQSEAGDLLGGFKPVNMTTLAMPMWEEFEDLFGKTFPPNKNKNFMKQVANAVSNNRWSRLLTLWRDAVRSFESKLESRKIRPQEFVQERFSKKRKVESQKPELLKPRWESFVGQLDTFQKHLESGSKGFAFSFVEGNIVKAARDGDWVLLDEINLAAPDTLDSLADLLIHGTDGAPSILLTETGETERIQAHKDFRIFGAMNPANDIGKRDLPISLRTRFFELFIESPDRDLDNLEPVVKAYLGEVEIARDAAQLYLEIQKLALDNHLVDGADQKPHYSLRTLTRTLIYAVDIAPIYSLRRALFEGFSMSFLTLLNQASSRLVFSLMERSLLGHQSNRRALLFQTPKLPGEAGNFVKFKQYWMAKGPLPAQKQDHYIITPLIEKNLLNLVRATSTRRFPVLLQGPTSSGKTSMVEYLAKISGHRFVRINNHEHTDLQEYLGTYVSGADGQLHYQEGILVQALREGFWIVLDELNLAPTDVLEALNRLLDDNRELFIPETQQVVRPHKNFMLFATQNPPVSYGGRKVLSRAFKNRFLELHFDDIPEDELEVILRERSQIAPSFCAKIVAVYKKLSLHRQQSRLFEQKNSFATLRDLFRWAFRDADDREQLAVNGYHLLAERVRDDNERRVVKDTIEEVMKIKIDSDAIYSTQKLPTFSKLDGAAAGIVWTKSMRRLYVLVTEALKNHEPVLLVGDTGSGKTSICQVIAAVMQTNLHVVNAHQSMETGDLIGSQRPVRSRHTSEARLHSQLHTFLVELLVMEKLHNSSLRQLIQAYQDLPRSSFETVPSSTARDLYECFSQYNALFEWVDGSLVHAMKGGQHFLLDEISLADDSVLERLNSVLEPGRSLFLAEKGVNDALIVAAKDFQFLATMNPGGDYGKKELSPALRNRFTEIWVSHPSDQQELEEILQVKLGQSRARLAKPMVDFAHWYGTEVSGAVPTVSVRDLLAWLAFLDTGCISDEHRSILHGASLVYIDTLGANPTAKSQLVGAGIEEQRQFCLNKLSTLFRYDMAGVYWEAVELGMGHERITVGPFDLKTYTSIPKQSTYCLQAPTTLRNAVKIARALKLPRPILVEGSPGVGKTTLVAALAQACGMPLTRINLSDQTDLMDLFGSDVPVEEGLAGQFQWRDAPFLRAMQNGEWVLLDEMNLASQSVLEGLNACFDHRGQVYVSELDQTFSRHPDFAIFAAQNPHRQGGGRKGLPASFVNRFSIVYADVFKADDLLMICSEKFPTIPTEVIKMLTRCVAGLDGAIQQSPRLTTTGGPWEINLRDTTRWLDLLSSHDGLLHAARAEDLVPVLFLQRFRTPEDYFAVSSLIESHLPQSFEPRHRSLRICASHVQVGLGLLSRQTVFSSQSDHHRLPYSHLPCVESVLLCIQKSWPCLLVGPSGSGKSAMIRHLAAGAGADLVELSMNANMDTTDLVGGYEQLDTEREHAAFLKRLKAFTKVVRLQIMRSGLNGSKSLTELEHQLSASHADFRDIVQNLRNAVNESPGMGFDTYLHEAETVVSKSLHDNRARFEWVDGILVQAVVEGKWLVLDNANLCSPSVLDRLNSLLEPDGVLNINERRSDDGSVRIVRPHTNFRIFMTMDPQHGELSRSMRNRNIEIFIPQPEDRPVCDGISLTVDSSTVRFEQLQRSCFSSAESLSSQELIWIFLDHLTFSDQILVKRWSEQVLAGLVEMSPELGRSFYSAIQLFTKIVRPGEKIVQGIKEMYTRLSYSLELPLGFWDAQPIQPLNNAVLLDLEHKVSASNHLLHLGKSLDLLIRAARLEDRLESIVTSCGNPTSMQLSRLQRSIVATRSRRFKEASTNPLASFLAESIKNLHLALEQTGLTQFMEDETAISRRGSEIDLSRLEECLTFLSDLIDVTHSTDFDEAEFQVYLSLGQQVVTLLYPDAETSTLAGALKSGLESFDASWKLGSGHSMALIWSRIRPTTPTTFEQLERKLQIEELAERFDNLIWASDIPFQRLVETRQMIAQMVKSTTSKQDIVRDDLEGISGALSDLEAQQTDTVASSKPYFQSGFEGLCQYQAGTDQSHEIESQDLLGLLAGEPTKQLLEQQDSSIGWQLFSSVSTITGIFKDEAALVTLRNTFSIDLLRTLSNVAEVPLRRLDLLREEMMHMASNTAKLTTTIHGDHLTVLLEYLRRLHGEQLHIHKDYLQADDSGEGSCSGSSAVSWQLAEDLLPSHQLRNVIHGYFQPSWDLTVRRDDQHSLSDTASAWVLFYTGCLKLYIPDRPYDPALKPLVIRDRHKKRKEELHIKLSALRHFERQTTGQCTNLRCQFVESQLEALGNEPAVDPVLRPRISETNQLQGVFNNILRSIVDRLPDQSGLPRLLSGDLSAVQEIEVLRLNISQAIANLCRGFRTYDDITRPLAAMLQGLDAGLAMVQLAVVPNHRGLPTIKHVCGSTPFFGMRIDYLSLENLDTIDSTRQEHYEPRLKYLESLTMMNGMCRILGPAVLTNAFGAFHSMYEHWKQQLSEDQQRHMAKSSMYRYRGSEAEADANEEEELYELFPDYEMADARSASNDRPQFRPRELAQRLAHLQRQLFDTDSDPVDRVRDLVRSGCADIARAWHNDTVMAKSPLPPQNFLCGLFCQLDQDMERINQAPAASALISFYTDPNLQEARKLVSLVQQVQGRYSEIKQAWPEHSTLDDVLRTSSEVLATRHTEPVARLITKVEKLHGYVHEWQIVASREYSTSALYDSLTSLLVNWRRLELSTWARLFDMEDRRCESEVDAWWFVAYEAIVAAPVSILDSGDDLEKHAEDLFATLQAFIINTALGHFSLRLGLLEVFKKYLGLMQQTIPRFEVIYSTLSNFLAFYSYYVIPIQQSIQTSRLALEKDMKDIILLASWKDTNINALRESAKRSHHKLFKIVRKYRALLARPAETVIQGAFPEPANEPATASKELRDQLDSLDISSPSKMEELQYDLSNRPARLRNIPTTVSNMVTMTQMHSLTIAISSVVEGYTDDLSKDIKSLREETPTTATDDNVELVKHLATRKRKLLSDTLKTVRHMGFRTNLSADALSHQASLAIILSRQAPIDAAAHSAIFNISEYRFHQLLNKMPMVREAQRAHSDDLNGAEVTRCVGYLESMLLCSIKQRTLAGNFAGRLVILDKAVEKMQNLWRSESLEVVPQTIDEKSVTSIQRIVSCLPHIINTGRLIIEKHGRFSEMDHTEILNHLQEWSRKFKTSAAILATMPALPGKLIYSSHQEGFQEAQRLIQPFKDEINQKIQSHPSLAFVLEQLLLWTDTSSNFANGHDSQAASLGVKDLDQKLTRTCDTVLVAIQAFEKTKSVAPSMDDQNWLLNSEKTLADGIKALHVPELSTAIEETMAELCQLTREDLNVATALIASVFPIINQYRNTCRNVLDHLAAKSRALNRMAATLADQFSKIASQGFCNPSKSGPAEAGKNEKLEEGTGLGEGEGAEDISKDIQDDEDLTELAQEGQKNKDGEEISDQEDAVNMDQDDLEGDLGDSKERNEEGDEEASAAGSGDNEIDEETGDVDDLDPNAVDEKLWDDDQKQSEKEKQGTKPKGAGEKDDQPDADGDQQNIDEGDADEERLSDTGAEEGEEIMQREEEKMDPHAQQGENLELPEEMDFDGQEKSSIASDIEDNDLDGLSNIGSEEDQQLDEAESKDDGEEQKEGWKEDQEVEKDEGGMEAEEVDIDQADEAGSPVDTDPDGDSDAEEDALLQNQTEDATVDKDNIVPSDAQGLAGQDANEDADTQMQESKATGSKGIASDHAHGEQSQAPANRGELGNLQDHSQDAPGGRDPANEDYTSPALKKLGDALEKWHRQQRQIQAAQSSPAPEPKTADVDMADTEFQHLENEDAEAHAQALGTATEDEALTLDQMALDSETQDQPRNLLPDETEEDHDEDTVMEDPDTHELEPNGRQEQSKPSTFIGP
ncbi:MAG: hypothetical protein Q9170_006033, partial [Blastenia crenularia]